MSARRWLAGASWSGAVLTGLAVDEGLLALAPAPTAAARRGVAMIDAGAPSPAQIDATTADRWRRVRVLLAEPLPATAWLRVWTRVQDEGAPPPSAPGTGAPDRADDAPQVTPRGVWRAAAVDAVDVRVMCPERGSLWVALELGGRGPDGARIVDISVDSGDDGPVTMLPAVYRMDDDGAVDGGDGIIGRFLGLVDAERSRTSSVLDELPVLLSPLSAPDRDDSPWLARLARWVALEPGQLPEHTAARRDAVALAHERHGRRGTRDGLVDEIARLTGIDALRIEVVEPIMSVDVWRLTGEPETSGLGVTTGLVRADPGPPVLDATALLDRSMLIHDDEAGLPVHASVAHRMCVHVVDGTPQQVAAVEAIVERARPAHVLACTCAVTRATGMPTTVGVDALPGPGPRGLANDAAHSPHIDGPGVRIGTARLPAPHGTTARTHTHAQEGAAP